MNDKIVIERWNTGLPSSDCYYITTCETTNGDTCVRIMYWKSKKNLFLVVEDCDDVVQVIGWVKSSDIEPYKE